MSWLREVLHVAGKDLRSLRWGLYLYALAVAGVTAWVRAGGWTSWDLLLPLALVLLGLVVAASLVQSDSPCRVDAFWVTRPLRPSAVFAAKALVVLGLVLGIGVLGQLTALVGWDLPARETLAVLGGSAVVFGSVLAAGLLVAALTRDLRSFALAMILLYVAWILGTFGVQTVARSAGLALGPPGPGSALSGTLGAFASAGLLAVLAHQYVTRNRPRTLLLAAAWWTLVVVASLGAPPSAPPEATASDPLPEHLRDARLAVEGMRPYGDGGRILVVRLKDPVPGHRYVLEAPILRLHEADGTESELPFPFDGPVALNDRELPALATGAVSDRTRPLGLQLSRDHWEALTGGEARLSLEGRMAVRKADVIAELALGSGQVVQRPGRRIRIGGLEKQEGLPEVSLEETSIGSWRGVRATARSGFSRDVLEVALVSPGSGEAARLAPGSGSAYSGVLVLPGAATWRSRRAYRLPPSAFGGRDLDEAWMRQAHLAVAEWVPLGSQPFRMELDVRGTGPQPPSP